MTTPLRLLPDSDPFGRTSITGMRGLIPERKLRRFVHGSFAFVHRSKNGVYDPMTYFHVVEALLQIEPDTYFRTNDLVGVLTDHQQNFIWDPTTVGRVLADIGETLEEKNNATYVATTRRWNGMMYSVTSALEGRAALVALLEDLFNLSEELVRQEMAGQFPKRTNSPLLQCPSVM
jgi:hypothetical protein